MLKVIVSKEKITGTIKGYSPPHNPVQVSPVQNTINSMGQSSDVLPPSYPDILPNSCDPFSSQKFASGTNARRSSSLSTGVDTAQFHADPAEYFEANPLLRSTDSGVVSSHLY